MSLELCQAPPRGSVLAIAPHPDDEVLGCGGTLALHARQGDPVALLVVFDGRLGLPPGGDPALRRGECLRGAQLLGVRDVTFWSEPEGHEPTPEQWERAVERLARHVRDVAPERVYAPWTGDEHPDHVRVARATLAALERAGFEGEALGYEVYRDLEPTRLVDVGAAWAAKRAALEEHVSQAAGGALVAGAERRARARAELWVGGAALCEAFAPLRPREGGAGGGPP